MTGWVVLIVAVVLFFGWRLFGGRTIAADVPIVGYTGPNGYGKTLVAVSDVIEDMRRGRVVYSTVPISCRWGESRPITCPGDFQRLPNGCTVFLDEVSVLFDARDTGTLPIEVRLFLRSMRHQDITLRWTSPSWSDADVNIRKITQVCVSLQALGRRHVKGTFWPRPVLILAGAMDTGGIKLDATPERVMRRRIWLPKRRPGWGAYDTHARVVFLGHPGTGGYCASCGGRVKVEYCTPARHRELGLLDVAEPSEPVDEEEPVAVT